MISALWFGMWLCAPADTEVLRLKIGQEIVGELVEETFDEAVGVTVRRIDDGALVPLRWEQLDPADVQRVRGRFGYLPDEPEPIYVEAVRLTLARGGQIVGTIVEQNEESFVFKQGNSLLPLRWDNLRGREVVQVDVLEVYDPEEYYQQQLFVLQPQSALDHYNVSLMCESLQLWSRVKEHLEIARSLDAGLKEGTLEDKRKRAQLRIDSGADSAQLSQAVRLARREHFTEALALLEQLLQKGSGSRLQGEAVRERAKIVKQRAQWLDDKVAANFFSFVDRLAQKIASTPDIGLSEARKQMELEAADASLLATAEYLRVPVEEVKEVWESPDRPIGATRAASYGGGTFTLGNERVMKGLLEEDKDKAAAKSTKEGGKPGDSTEPATLEDKIKRMLEEKKQQREAQEKKAKDKKKETKQRRIADVKPTADEWWAAARTQERVDYLKAFWVERDSHVRVLKILARNCSACAGAGFFHFSTQTGQDGRQECSRCKTLGFDRIVHYR